MERVKDEVIMMILLVIRIIITNNNNESNKILKEHNGNYDQITDG
jgi:hypothetical protein